MTPRRLPRPRGLLLDFGGVVAIATTRDGWQAAVAERIERLMRRGGITELTVARITADITAGALADARWKDAMSRPRAPRELTYQEFWADFVAADWPAASHEWVTHNARELCRTVGELRQARTLRDGLTDLLDAADRCGVPVGIVSNALMGDVHRAFLHEHHLGRRFAAQVYSDEAGVRKPNPRLIELGANAIDVPVADCWYVGDNHDRDVLCGHRAAAGATVLLEAPDTWDLPYTPLLEPDLAVATLAELTDAFDGASTVAQC